MNAPCAGLPLDACCARQRRNNSTLPVRSSSPTLTGIMGKERLIAELALAAQSMVQGSLSELTRQCGVITGLSPRFTSPRLTPKAWARDRAALQIGQISEGRKRATSPLGGRASHRIAGRQANSADGTTVSLPFTSPEPVDDKPAQTCRVSQVGLCEGGQEYLAVCNRRRVELGK